MMLVMLSNTKVSEIPGISAAGASLELIKYTPPADIEYVYYGRPRIIDAVPVTPLGHPTPAIITRGSRLLAGFPIIAVRAGSYLAPLAPHVHLWEAPGGDIREETAVRNHEELLLRAETLGEEIRSETLVVGESTPGGTTTALAVLRGLGYEARTSSAFNHNPVELKERVVEKALKRIRTGLSPVEVAAEVGDPFIVATVGLARGYRGRLVLAGGTQMLAVAAVLREEGIRPMVATTKYIAEDRSASFVDTAREIGVDFYAAPLDFSSSRFPGLRGYEEGHVKEGVGAGGSVWLANKMGVSTEDVVRKVEELYAQLTS